ncbi:hypothetical protein P154DRAFT_524127 [Amniculicola lignicola CBS 123094]|uniref:Uncharacterized protein n=1 Tax=Amniculicola lignicola CBS 123094 TaxID=1392246 RepID=A0A6A5WBZ4_9PLEO|nr:hypothetical protein P154DRAFT_524127 [Amniculicola lignicola CBS 123094]
MASSPSHTWKCYSQTRRSHDMHDDMGGRHYSNLGEDSQKSSPHPFARCTLIKAVLVINPIVLTVLGLVVALALNLRSSTAYERYMEGRRLWSFLGAISQNLARVVWTQATEREGDLGKQDLLAKVTFLNMIIAFPVSLKHKLRFEPYIQYDDLFDLVGHLNTFAKAAGEPTVRKKKVRKCKALGELLRIPMARSNPRKEIKRAKRPLGNIPLEILSYMSAYIKHIMDNGTFQTGIAQTHAFNNMQSLNEILAHTDRILNTPLPLAYIIAISQVTWIYVLSLPFQLAGILGWSAIPVCGFSAYIILGIAAIGNEIENPFGSEVNDLPMELFCAEIASDITIIASRPTAKPRDYFKHPDNKPLYPISSADFEFWASKDVAEIRDGLSMRACISKGAMWQRQASYAETSGGSEVIECEANEVVDEGKNGGDDCNGTRFGGARHHGHDGHTGHHCEGDGV